MKKGRKFKEILRAEIQRGIECCKENILSFLDTASKLLEVDKLNHSSVCAEFVIEELGKIFMIKEAVQNSTDPVKVPVTVFQNHKGKSDRA